MNPDDLAKILDELGQRLGPAGSHVFELAVRQQLIFGGTLLLLTVAMGGFSLASLGLAIGLTRRHPGSNTAGDDAIAAFGIFGMIFVVCFAAFLFFGLDKLLNPEYAAIRDILSAIKP